MSRLKATSSCLDQLFLHISLPAWIWADVRKLILVEEQLAILAQPENLILEGVLGLKAVCDPEPRVFSTLNRR